MRFPTLKNAGLALLRRRRIHYEFQPKTGERRGHCHSRGGALKRELKKKKPVKMEEPMQREENIKIDIVKIQMVRDGSIQYGKKPISLPEELPELGLKLLKNADRENFILVCLNAKNYVNCIHLVAIGTLDRTVVSPREVLKAALLSNASSIAFIHNHPSGDPKPSPEDISLTNTLGKCADLFQIKVLDHVIVVDDGRYESLLEKKLLTPS
jgi:DNA repair protein RadC